MMYDIACILVQHLRASEDGDYLLDRIKFALPSFHAYGHNAACQVSIAMYWNTSEKFILPQMSKFVMCVHIMCVCYKYPWTILDSVNSKCEIVMDLYNNNMLSIYVGCVQSYTC